MKPEFALHDLLHNSALREPGRPAVVDGDITLTYAELERRSGALAAALVDAGVEPADRVAVYMEKSWQAVVAMFAASRIGAAFVNVNPLLKSRQVRHIARDCTPRAFIIDSSRVSELEPGTMPVAFFCGHRPAGDVAGMLDLDAAIQDHDGESPVRQVIEGDLASILYTSGSTGLPKGVAVSQRNLVVGAQIVSAYLENTADDRILSVLPFSFDYGLNQLTTAVRVSATLVLQRSRLPGDLVRSLRRQRITGLAGVPPLWSVLLQAATSLEGDPLRHLRYITNSGGRVPAAHLAELRRLLTGTRIYLMYGLTEAFRSTYLPPEEVDRGPECMGRPVPNTEISVVDETGRECLPGEVGELVHRGPTVALGYWGDGEMTARVFRRSPHLAQHLETGERIVHSGDLVRRDEDGFLYFVGRRDALIKTQGYRVSSEEVEDLLVGTGLVREACVFGVSDQEQGQVLVAVVSPQSGNGLSAETVRAACLDSGPPYLVPKEIIIQPELPRGPTGKIDRRAIADAFANR